MSSPAPNRESLQRRALRLEYATIVWNVGEAGLAIGLGLAAGSLALVGFGVDSVVEVFASVVVVWHLRSTHAADHPGRTRRALQLTAGAFLALAIVLTIAGINDLVSGRQAGESPWGITYLAITVVVMFGLAFLKRRTAGELGSAPLAAEAAMTFLDGWLAAATLLGLALNAAVGWWWADPAAALIVAMAAANEARENWEEAGELG
ncbi:MAG: cation transporter [bacterium]|nr:cation transporter [bacterium]